VTDNIAQVYFWGTGRRKTATARVRIREGNGEIQVNGRSLKEYFTTERQRMSAIAPLLSVDMLGKLNVYASISGGGLTGHSGAFSHGVARALSRLDPGLVKTLRKGGFLMRDPRVVERKMYGHHKSRRSTQFSKR